MYVHGMYTLITQRQSAGLSSIMAENKAPVIQAISVYFLLFLVNSKHLQSAMAQSEAGRGFSYPLHKSYSCVESRSDSLQDHVPYWPSPTSNHIRVTHACSAPLLLFSRLATRDSTGDAPRRGKLYAHQK